MKVVILAGGLGTRISEESHLKPKPMIEIGERPILWHIWLLPYGYNEFIICLGYKGNTIKDYFAYYLWFDVTFDMKYGNNMQVHDNTVEPWKVHSQYRDRYTDRRRLEKSQAISTEQSFMTYGDGVRMLILGSPALPS